MRPGGLRRAAVFALADQGLTSAANFAASAVLIRLATKSDYGRYVVAYATLLLVGSTVDVLFSLQMTYLAPHEPEEARRTFCSALRTAQTLTSAALGAVVCLACAVGYLSGFVDGGNASFGVMIGVGSLLLSWQEYYRSVFYLFGQAGHALLLTVVQLVTWAIAVALAIGAGLTHMNLAVFAGLCVGTAVSTLVGYWIFPLPSAGGFSAVRAAAAKAWVQGSWSLLGSIVSWVQGQSYVWLLAILASPAVTAEANFAKLFFSPLSLMLVAVNRVARPVLGTVYAQEGRNAAVRQGRHLLALVAGLTAVYVPAILLSENAIIRGTKTTAYANATVLIAAWGAVTAFQVTRWNSTLLLGVLHRNREMTSVQLVSVVIGVGASIALIPTFAAMGAIASVGIGELVLTILMWREVNRSAIARPAS